MNPRAEAEATAGVLRDRRILVTRAAAQAGVLSGLLRDAGAEVVEVPLIAFKPAFDQGAVRRGILGFAAYDLLVFTSANAVRAFATAATSHGVELSRTGGDQVLPSVVAIGPVTAAAVQAMGMEPRELPRRFSAAALAEGLLADDVAGKRVLIPRAEVAGEELPRRLRRAGAEVDVLAMYRTVPHPDARRLVSRLLGSGLDMVTFASASAVRSFVVAAGPEFRRPAGVEVACIGPVTAEAARAAGLQPEVVAGEHTAAGLAAAILAHAARGRTGVA